VNALPSFHTIVMVGFRPTIHDLLPATELVRPEKVVDGRDKRDHDDRVKRVYPHRSRNDGRR
jgi:hypothetical protein